MIPIEAFFRSDLNLNFVEGRHYLHLVLHLYEESTKITITAGLHTSQESSDAPQFIQVVFPRRNSMWA